MYDRNRSRAISRVCNLLERLERSDRVFTLTYHAGKFLISPRHADVVGDTPGDCGGGAEVHTFDPSDLEQVVKYVPLAGEYDWGQFVAADDVLY